MDDLFKSIGQAILGMPPVLAAAVILALAVLGLVYAWRKAGAEAERERDAAEVARGHGVTAKLDAIHGDIRAVSGMVETIKTGIEVLKDRR